MLVVVTMVTMVTLRDMRDLFEPRACRGWNSQNGSPAKKLMVMAVEVRKEVPTVEEERKESRGEAMGKDG